MTNIPEDSMLRRHYLTELRSKQRANFDAFTQATQGSVIEAKVPEAVAGTDYPVWTTACFIMLMVFLFL